MSVPDVILVQLGRQCLQRAWAAHRLPPAVRYRLACPSPCHQMQEPVWKPEGYEAEAEQRKDAAWVEGKSAEELAELDDEFGDDRFLAEYRWVGG